MKKFSAKDGVLVAFLVGILPHAEHMPWLAIVFCAVIGTWGLLQNKIDFYVMPKTAKNIFAFAAVAALFASYRTFLGLEPGIAFIAMIGCLKLHEMRSKGEVVMVNWLATLLILGEVIYAQNAFTSVFCFFGTYLVIQNQIRINAVNHPAETAEKLPLKKIHATLWVSVPIAVLFFLLFPRIQLSFFNPLGMDNRDRIGFNDEMRLGDLENLAKSDATAFRVSFVEGKVPVYQNMYWRGAVLTGTDGLNWVKAKKDFQELPVQEGNVTSVQEILLEPHQNFWLFGLEQPLRMEVLKNPDMDIRRLRESTFEIGMRVRERLLYRVSSGEPLQDKLALDPKDLRRSMQLSRKLDPRIAALVEKIKGSATRDTEIIENIKKYFGEGGFEYSLSSPKLESPTIAEFLFHTKKGFCEYFASAMGILLRASGVPARVVVGYQGGVLNSYGNYWMVRSMDAHAWVEAWVQGEGWRRIDPTAIVAPQRISQNFSPDLALAGGGIGEFLKRRLGVNSEVHDWRWLISESAFFIDNLDSQWNHFLIAYDMDYQRGLLEHYAGKKPLWLALLWIFSGAAGLILGIFAYLFYSKRIPKDPLVEVYGALVKRLARRGVIKRANEGPHHFSRRAQMQAPEVAPEIRAAISLYVDLRYGPPKADKANIVELRRRVKRVS